MNKKLGSWLQRNYEFCHTDAELCGGVTDEILLPRSCVPGTLSDTTGAFQPSSSCCFKCFEVWDGNWLSVLSERLGALFSFGI